MESKKNWLEILVMVFGMTVVSCDNGSTGGSSVEKTLVITFGL